MTTFAETSRLSHSEEPPQTHRFTREEYYLIAESGIFDGQRVELINGEILDMSPQNNPHYLSVSLVTAALQKIFGQGFWVRAQGPLSIDAHSDPEPDIAVVAGDMRSFKEHPTTALLVVEVSDTTLRFDRGQKASLYARDGIADYGVVNIGGRCLEVHRDPIEDPAAPLGWRYQTVTTLRAGQSVSPLANAGAVILVDDLLP